MWSRLKNQVHAVLAEHGVEIEVADLFGRAGRRFLSELELPALSRQRVDACLRLLDQLAAELELADQELKRTFAGDARVERLLPIPGIGLIVAATIVAEVCNVDRFRTSDQLCSWAGLTPSEHSSADNIRRGHISEQGSRWLRWVMVEAAVQALRNPELRRLFLRVAQRRGVKIARVAVARRLLTLALTPPRSH
jgi:transposase